MKEARIKHNQIPFLENHTVIILTDLGNGFTPCLFLMSSQENLDGKDLFMIAIL